MNKKIIICLLLATGTFTLQAQVTKKVATKAKTTMSKSKATASKSKGTISVMSLSKLDSVSYAFGQKIAESLKPEGLTGLNYLFLNKGMQDVFNGNTVMIDSRTSQNIIQEFLTSAKKSKYDSVLTAGENFLKENKAKANIKTLSSGLQYEILKDSVGGLQPVATDEVTVHYRGTLLNGKEFDSSYSRNEPATFGLNKVIPGWTEGVQLMTEGDKYRFFIPYQLAYGERGAGADIPPYSTLIFEVELIKVNKK